MFLKIHLFVTSFYNCVSPIGSFTISNILALGSPSEFEFLLNFLTSNLRVTFVPLDKNNFYQLISYEE